MIRETRRLYLDYINESDKEDYFINISHDKLVLETFICKYCDNINDLDISKYINNNRIFAIRLKETSKLIGILSIYQENVDSLECEIGYGIGSNYWNKGYATEAVKEFISYLFDECNYTKILASYFIGNDASKKVMVKSFMKYSHTVYNELEYLGISRDLDYYYINKEEYLNYKKEGLFMKVYENPNKVVADKIKQGLINTGGYCPCRVFRTEDFKCMCKEFRDQIKDPNFEGFCHCMLYYKEK